MKILPLLTALSLPIMAAEPNTLTAEEASAGFKLLFDGESAAAFRGFKKPDLPEQWRVKHGALVLTTGGGGDLITREQFKDFELRFEFQIAPDGNSGVMWRVTEEAANTYDSGPEYQILDSHSSTGYPAEREKGNISGALYDLLPAKPEAFRGPDEWNEGVIRVEGPKITLSLNGHVTAEIDTSTDEWRNLLAGSKFADWELFNKMESGHIALQDHGDIVGFRSLRILEL